MTLAKINLNDVEYNILLETLSYVNNNAVENSVKLLSNIIPDTKTSIDMIEDDNNKNWDEYVSYYEYTYHRKYDKHDNNKYDNFKIKDSGVNNMIYIKSCGVLLNFIERMIRNMVNYEKYNQVENIDIDNACPYLCFSLIENYHEKTPMYIIEQWMQEKKTLPYQLIKHVISEKGYDFNIKKKNNIWTLELSISNKKRQREE